MTGAAIVTWFMRLESRLNNMLTIDMHQNICEKANDDLKESLAEIKDLAKDAICEREKIGDELTSYRRVIGEELTDIKIKLAVLISHNNK